MNQTKLWALGGMMLLSSLFAVNANAVNIPISSIATNATKTGTGSCVQGYYSNTWTSSASYFQYTLSTVGYTGTIAMDFNTQRSSTGPTVMQIWYNYNGTWNLLPVADGGTFTVGTGCATKTATLPAVCSGVPTLLVKFQPTTPFPSNAAGTFRADSINVFDAASSSCAGTPTGGSVNGATTICAGNTASLSLAGATGGTGITYQWQSSPNGSTWTNIAGATSLTYNTPALSSTTHYRVVVCCGANCANSSAAIVTVNALPTVAAITGYTAPLLVDGTQALANATAGGVWTSTNEDAVTVDLISGVITGEFGGSSVISYSVTDGNGCTGVSTVNVDAVWPNTLALYAGQNGTSVDVINVPGDVVSDLTATGFGAATPCGSGGLSGLTINVGDSVLNLASGPRVSYKVYPTAGNALTMFRIHARARVSSTGPTKAYIAYRFWSDGAPTSGWIAEAAPRTLTSGSCGASANSWDFNTGFAVNPNPTVNGITDSLEVAVFPLKPGASTGTFQLNTLEVYGIVTPNTPCSDGGIIVTTDSVLPRVVNICDSGARFLNYNIGFGGVAGPGIEYQWENSTDGVNWTPIANANGAVYQTPNYVAGVSPDTIYHRVAVTCILDGGTPAYSSVNVVTVHATPANAGTISASPSIPTKRMLIGTPYTMSSSVAGGTWSSNDTSTISFGGTNVATPNLPGDAVITYRASVNGCTATSRDTFIALHPGTKALYIGKNGNSTAVVAATGATATSLATANWGSAATCGNGGISGLTNTTTAQNTTTNGIISTTVGTSGAAFDVTSIRATVRKQPSGAYKAYLGHRPTGGSWTIDPSPVDVESDDCGYSHNELVFPVTGVNISGASTYEFAVFGYNGTATTTFQLNSLSVLGNGAQLINGMINTVANSNVQLFPNPATNVLNVKAPGKVTVAIYSIEGKKLIEQQNAKSIDVSSLVNGMYLVQVYGENNSLLKTEKFIKK